MSHQDILVMRTTIRLDDPLLRRAKAQAAASGRSLNDFVADAIRAALSPRGTRAPAIALPSFGGRGLQPGVDLDDSAALLDRLEGSSDYPVAARRARSKNVAEHRSRPGT